MARITITTGGSRGDVQPYVALGVGLQRAGHGVRIACAEPFEEMVRGRGLEFHPVFGDVRRLVEELLAAEPGPVRFARQISRLLEPTLRRSLADYEEACRDADVVVWGPLGLLGHAIARKMGVPAVAAYLQPIFSGTRLYRSSFLPPPPAALRGRTLLDAYNRLTYVAAQQIFWQAFRRPLNRLSAEELGLAPTPLWGPFREGRRRGDLVLNGWSPAVLPPAPEWPRSVRTTGYWFLPRQGGWEPPAGLVDFLGAGPPPVSVGFGSINESDPEELTSVTLRALRKSGHRGLLLTGWGGLAGEPLAGQDPKGATPELPDYAYRVEDVPHDWLFQRVAAVVHHGGAGTTAAALRSGLPSVVVPFMADQAFWGEIVSEMGAGVRPLPRRRLNAQDLAHAIGRATADGRMWANARRMGALIRAEDGVGRAVEALQEHLDAHG